MAYHHVIAKVGQVDKCRVLFSDLTLADLRKRFTTPYEKGISFFSGNELIAPNDLRSIQILKTERVEKEERESLNNASLAHIHELNQSSSGLVFISPGTGYEPEDLADAGQDITHSVVKGPPGFRAGRWGKPGKLLAWIAGIIAVVAAAGVIKWLGWG